MFELKNVLIEYEYYPVWINSCRQGLEFAHRQTIKQRDERTEGTRLNNIPTIIRLSGVAVK